MMTVFQPDTTLPTKVASFEKAAIFGALGNFARRMVPQATSFARNAIPRAGTSAFSKYMPKGIASSLQPMAQKAEQGLVRGAGNMFGPQGQAVAQKLFKGAPGRAVRDAAGGAMVGGVLEGGLNAATTEPGQGGSAFFKGMGTGMLNGAIGGAATGMAGRMVSNTRASALQQLAQRNGQKVGPLGKQMNNMSFRDAARNAFGSGGDMQQQLARQKLIGGAGTFGAEFALPMALPVVGGGGGAQPQQIPQYPQGGYPQYKTSSAEIRLNPIDFSKIPGYHTA